MTTLQYYRKTFLPMQALILVACVIFYFVGKVPLPVVGIVFVVMELFSFVGAAWAASIRRRAEAADRDKLPLHHRKR